VRTRSAPDSAFRAGSYFYVRTMDWRDRTLRPPTTSHNTALRSKRSSSQNNSKKQLSELQLPEQQYSRSAATARSAAPSPASASGPAWNHQRSPLLPFPEPHSTIRPFHNRGPPVDRCSRKRRLQQRELVGNRLAASANQARRERIPTACHSAQIVSCTDVFVSHREIAAAPSEQIMQSSVPQYYSIAYIAGRLA
jgi:hypothetical protein